MCLNFIKLIMWTDTFRLQRKVDKKLLLWQSLSTVPCCAFSTRLLPEVKVFPLCPASRVRGERNLERRMQINIVPMMESLMDAGSWGLDALSTAVPRKMLMLWALIWGWRNYTKAQHLFRSLSTASAKQASQNCYEKLTKLILNWHNDRKKVLPDFYFGFSRSQQHWRNTLGIFTLFSPWH